jgi:hypothetical protein
MQTADSHTLQISALSIMIGDLQNNAFVDLIEVVSKFSFLVKLQILERDSEMRGLPAIDRLQNLVPELSLS